MYGYIIGNMGIGYFTYIGHTGTVVLSWGGGAPPFQVKKPMGDHLKYKNQYLFQYDTTKSLSISEVIHNNKTINLNSKLLFYSHFAF